MITSLLVTALLAAQTPAAPTGGPDTSLRVPSRRWAIVVGAGDYEHLGRLRYAEKDARAVADALVKDLAFEPDHVRLLVDHPDEPELTPTAGHVYGELEALIASRHANRSDLVLFYFCGHGAGGADGDFLLPTDARKETVKELGLPVKRVVDRLASAGMHNVLVLVDACREGQENPFGRDLFELADKARLAVVLGCEPGAQSYEDASLGHGVFTHFLLETLADKGLLDPVSGALWASRVARETSERVQRWSRGKDPAQRPVAWTDGTRDILLGAAPPPAGTAGGVASFVASTKPLDADAHIAALGAYAETLYEADRVPEALEVLKTAEQLGPLPPELSLLLGLVALDAGRTVEAARAFAGVRAQSPGGFLTWFATVVDTSGAVTERQRAEAARSLWSSGTEVSPGLLARMVESAISGGAGAEAQAMCRAAIEQCGAQSRVGKYLQGALSAIHGEDDAAVEAFQGALATPGEFPLDDMLVREVLGALYRAHGTAAAVAFTDTCVERWPDDGRWRAERACLRSLAAQSAHDLDLVVADARAALERTLPPEDVWLVTRAAGARAKELTPAIRAQAAAHPLAWQAQLAALVVDEGADAAKRLEEIAQLSPRPAGVYVAFAAHQLSAELERTRNSLSGRAPDDPAIEHLSDEVSLSLQRCLELLTPLAADLADDPDAWTVVATLYRSRSLHEAQMRLFERHLGPLAEARRLPRELVVTYAQACLDTGRFDAFERLVPAVEKDSLEADTLAWLGAAWLAANGRYDEARQHLGQRTKPLALEFAPIAGPLRALIAAGTGSPKLARLSLPAEDPDDPLALALTGIAERLLGGAERAARIDALLEEAPPQRGFFAIVGFWKSDRDANPLILAIRAAFYYPGNPLLREASFAGEPGLPAFAGVYTYKLTDVSGPIDALGSELTLTVKQSGQLVGTLELAGGSTVALKGAVDAYGNLEAEIPGPEGPCKLIAKLAPRAAYAEVQTLTTVGQPLQLLTADCLPYAWFAQLQE